MVGVPSQGCAERVRCAPSSASMDASTCVIILASDGSAAVASARHESAALDGSAAEARRASVSSATGWLRQAGSPSALSASPTSGPPGKLAQASAKSGRAKGQSPLCSKAVAASSQLPAASAARPALAQRFSAGAIGSSSRGARKSSKRAQKPASSICSRVAASSRASSSRRARTSTEAAAAMAVWSCGSPISTACKRES